MLDCPTLVNNNGLTSTILLKLIEKDLSSKLNIVHEIKKLGQVDLLNQRNGGKKFNLREHVKGLILSFLSSDVPWKRIQGSLIEIDDIFCQYDWHEIIKKSPERINEELKRIKCGGLARRKQLANLNDNLNHLVGYGIKHGSIDNFVTSRPPNAIAHKLEVDMAEVGFALASEYLKNVGIDMIKPDRHINSFFSSKRLGLCNIKNPKPDQVYFKAKEIAKSANTSLLYLDNIIWLHCAEGFGEICTKVPKCVQCSLKQFCNNT